MGRRGVQNEADKTKERFLRWTEKLRVNEDRIKLKVPDNTKSVINTKDNIIKDKAEDLVNSTKTEDRLDRDKYYIVNPDH
ncbi:MAG: hypothetical protein HON76_00710 [Candidatus Scalindua sp.]|jgi:hypothetical protein|nr:hypothetical protein [Candidatus Scalindua sp.]MBT5305325.1 hypothetical protein [Candidatus Scalindua sp.]MBT6050323.1 hypothetical protein [Candidatus Scalindua sp.]MBT6561032.1 hypothetical protein [Candidatus Scalindua sp.]MBT7211459.1 hypothetical protein [Candidatus Scalindua sp.]